MVLVLQISWAKIILLSGLATAFLLYMGINSGFLIEADGAYCAATCQKRLAEQADKEKRESSTTKKTETKCYGIYCDKVEKKDKDEQNIEKLKKKFGERNFISIRISESCKLIDYCPKYKELATMYDNSNKWLSGDFITDDETGDWKRENPRGYNVFEFYKFFDMPWVLWVDPDDYTWKRTKQIEIHPHISPYIDRTDVFENQIRYEYKNLDYNPCYFAKVGWKDKQTDELVGEEILLDVLNHFYSNCDEPVKYDPKIEIFMNSTIFPDCDRDCFDYRKQMQLVDKAYFQLEKERYEELEEKDKKDDKPKCYGIYCDREVEDTDKSKTEQIKDRIQELEDIQLCEKLKRGETSRTAERLDCNDDDERKEYLDEKIQEDPHDDLDPEIIECEKYRAYEINVNNATEFSRVTCLDKFERDDFLEIMRVKYPDGI